ncbi:hypothetical protein [Virgibacillus chiguensis]|uniref:Uncharacterized protein n=1 Tax=Virgibacillus chiguensis TaxID=411959 RepID=A0A1M5PEQ9_9BACI|nr:hypothetical protein [Virgibacillus chiguensis]SHG99733.1 hypothetical protein SAMN05421807_10320 [Virgibacillus chiguensis]
MSKRKYVLIGIMLMVFFVIGYFNISLTSLPTTFVNVFKDNLTNEEKFEQVNRIEIRQGGIVTEDFDYIAPENDSVLTLDNEDEIYQILNSDLRIYNGGRIEDNTNSVFYLFIRFEDGAEQQYKIAKEYIVVSLPNNYKKYKVLDDNNELYDYLKSLYNE